MTSIAIVGPGAIGGVLAAWLAANPKNDVSLCARSPFDELVVAAPGRVLRFKLPIHLPGDAPPPVDWIVLAAKTYQVADAARWLPGLRHDGTRLAVVQNGVEHLARLAPHFDPARTVPVIIDCPAEREAPGRVLQRANVAMTAPDSANGAAFAALFNEPAVDCRLDGDWISAAWRKLCINAAGAVCALTNRPANIARDPAAIAVMESLIRECIAVGRAEGADLDDAIAQRVVASQQAAPDGAMNSIHADRAARRPMEWDARNGVIARLGQKHGIPAPCNAMAAQLLELIERSYTP